MFNRNSSKGKAIVMWSFILVLAFSLTACGGSKNNNKAAEALATADNKILTIEELAPLAKAEGKVVSVGMPDSWANWKDTWADLNSKYGLSHSDTDMGSVDEINKFDAEKNNPTADIGDVGIAFGSMAVEKGVTQPFKTQYWDDIPDWAKDKDGHWMLGYTGSISFVCNNELVANCPKSWADIENNGGAYKLAIGDVTGGAQPQHALLAAAIAFGGDEGNLQPGVEYFQRLAKT